MKGIPFRDMQSRYPMCLQYETEAQRQLLRRELGDLLVNDRGRDMVYVAQGWTNQEDARRAISILKQ